MTFSHSLAFLSEVKKGSHFPAHVYPITIQFAGEPDHVHRIPVLNFQKEALEKLLDQKLFILLPFRLLRIRRELEKNHSKEQAEALIALYKDDIILPIQKAYDQGYISWRDRLNLLAIARRLVRHLYEKYDEIWKGVELMRFQTLELDIDEYEEKYDALEAKVAERDNLIEEKDNLIEEKNNLIDEQKKRILFLEAQLAELKKQS